MPADASPENPDWLVAMLQRAEAYPNKPDRVELKQTHISWVFLAGESVYKLKKPVSFSFLDYSTVEKRLEACREEVRLNRRLAPDVYLGVEPVIGTPGGVKIGGIGNPVDHVVVMRRLPDDRMLDVLLARGAASEADAKKIIDILVPFYRRASRNQELLEFATVKAIEANLRDNLDGLEETEGVDARAAARLKSSQLQYLRLAEPLFLARLANGFICEGHGDLRPDHVCLVEPPVIFDCVEFSASLRVADVVSELAFLAMECDMHGAPDFGRALLDGYREVSGDRFPDSLAKFYMAYRACVRGKVAALRAQQQHGGERETSLKSARRYAQLGSSYAVDFYKPLLLVTVGPAGCGKSTVAREVSEALGATIIRTDEVRHELAGGRDPNAPAGSGMYSAEMTARTYSAVFERAEKLLAAADAVVLDGTFHDERQRKAARELAASTGVEVHFLLCSCSIEEAVARIRRRRAQGTDISDAREETHIEQRAVLDIADDLAGPDVVALDCEGTRASRLEAILVSLRRTLPSFDS